MPANDTGWPLIPATARQRREADRFFADLVGRRPTRTAAEDEPTAPTEIDLLVRVHGRFGGDLSAEIRVRSGGTDLATRTIGAAPGDLTFRVARRDRYEITVTPTAARPNDRYDRTRQNFRPRAPYTSNVASIALAVNRWNALNVYDTWDAERIDRARARDVSPQPLCGRRVQINRAAQTRLAAANAAFLALDAAARQEITSSLLITGGYALRTQTTGAFSNHSLGVAVDVNYNLSTKQNNHFRLGSGDEGRNNRSVLEFVQEVVRMDPRYATYDLFASRTDLLHWDAAAMFNVLFPPWLEGLVAQANGRTVVSAAPSTATFTASPQPARALSVTRVDVQRGSAVATDRDIRSKLALVLREWESIQAWLYGAPVTADDGRALGTLVGLVPMDRRFVELMIGAGWNWGGNWRGSKDFMHFEDRDAFASLRTVGPGSGGATTEAEQDELSELFEHEHDVHG